MINQKLVKVKTENATYIGYFVNDDELLYMDLDRQQTLNLHDVKGNIVITQLNQ